MRWCLLGSWDTDNGSLYSAPLNLIALCCSSPVWAHSPACELLSFVEIVSSGFREPKGDCQPQHLLQSSNSYLFSTASPELCFYRKLKNCSIWHAASPLAATGSGGYEVGWLDGVVCSLNHTSWIRTVQKCVSLQGHQTVSELWGLAWLGRDHSSRQEPSCTRDQSGRVEGQSGSNIIGWISFIV